MAYLRLKTVLTDNMDYCFCGSISDSNACEIALSCGEEVGDAYPHDPFSVCVHLDPDFPGVKRPSIVGNTQSLLVLSCDAMAVLENSLQLGKYESFPFSLINHKGRVHSREYVFFNPVGHYPIADPSSDFLRYTRSQKIYGCTKWVLNSESLVEIPDIVRASELPTHYFVSERFKAVVYESKLTNFEFDGVEHV